MLNVTLRRWLDYFCCE